MLMHEKDWLDQIGEDEKAEMEEGLILVEWGEVVSHKQVMAKGGFYIFY